MHEVNVATHYIQFKAQIKKVLPFFETVEH